MKRRTPYRKVVTDAVLYDFPEPTATQRIALVQRSHGGNLLEVETGDGGTGSRGLAMLPTKFRKLVWVKRGDAVIVSEAAGSFVTAEGEAGAVRFIVEHILYADQVKHLRAVGKWPACLNDAPATAADAIAAAAPRRRGRAAAGDGGRDDDRESDEGEAADEDSEDGAFGHAAATSAVSRGRPGELPPSDDEEEGEDEGEDGAAETDAAGNTVVRADSGGDAAATAAAAPAAVGHADGGDVAPLGAALAGMAIK